MEESRRELYFVPWANLGALFNELILITVLWPKAGCCIGRGGHHAIRRGPGGLGRENGE